MRQLYAAITLFLLVLQILAILCALAQPAYAYVDPGSGLLALQIVSSTVAGFIFIVRNRIRKHFGRFFRTRHSEQNTGGSGDLAQK